MTIPWAPTHLAVVVDGSADNGADCAVHSRRVTARRHHTNSLLDASERRGHVVSGHGEGTVRDGYLGCRGSDSEGFAGGEWCVGAVVVVLQTERSGSSWDSL